MTRTFLIAAVIALGMPFAARAEIMVAATLEWLADHCPDSGVYEARDIEREKHPTNSHNVSFSLKRTLRGKPPRSVIDLYYPSKHVKRELPSVRVGDEFLVCFQHHSTGEVRPVQLINLTNPGLSFPTFIAVSCDVKLLRTGKDVLKVFESRLRLRPKGDPVEISDYSKDNRFELEPHTEPFSAIWGGSTCYLRVPKDLGGTVKAASELQSNSAPQDTGGNKRDSQSPHRPIPLQEANLDINTLRGWGTRHYVYQAERGGELGLLGTVTMRTELHDDRVTLSDDWQLDWRGRRIKLALNMECRRNNLLRPTMIRSAGEGDDEVGTFTVVVGDSDATVTNDGGQTRKIDFPGDTLTDVAMFRIFTLLSTAEGAAFSVGHVMEVSELNLKGPAEIVYRGLEQITLHGKPIRLHKFTYVRNDRTVAEAWIDSDHMLRQLRLDGRKVLTEKRQ